MTQRILTMENDLERKVIHRDFEDHLLWNNHILIQADTIKKIAYNHGMPLEILTQKKAIERCYRDIQNFALTEEFKIFIATIYGEAATSSEIAWKCVAHVIVNLLSPTTS
jgi:hypothetical protein